MIVQITGETQLPQQIVSADGGATLPTSGPLFADNTPIIPFEKLKEEAIKHALKSTSGNIVDAAKKLQVGRATLYRLIEKYNITAKKE